MLQLFELNKNSIVGTGKPFEVACSRINAPRSSQQQQTLLLYLKGQLQRTGLAFENCGIYATCQPNELRNIMSSIRLLRASNMILHVIQNNNNT